MASVRCAFWAAVLGAAAATDSSAVVTARIMAQFDTDSSGDISVVEMHEWLSMQVGRNGKQNRISLSDVRKLLRRSRGNGIKSLPQKCKIT